jgi:lysophospholipase L1-like esterase
MLHVLKKPDVAPMRTRQMSRRRRFVISTTVVCLSFLIGFAILEFGLAQFYYSNLDELRQDEFDAELGWRLKPGKYVVKAPDRLSRYTVYINSMGIRDTELKPKLENGVRRMIILGDSFTFGQTADDETLFSTRLERNLNGSKTGRQYDVVNAGVPGYGNGQELLLLRRLAQTGIVADVYVLNLFTNDILDNLRLDYANRSQNPIQPGFVLDSHGRLSFAHKPQNTLREGSNLVAARAPSGSKVFSIIRSKLRSLAQTNPRLIRFAHKLGVNIAIPRMPGVISAWYDDEVTAKGVPLMKALIAEINSEARSHNAILLVSLIPSPMQVYTETYGQVLRASFPHDPMTEKFIEDPLRPQRIIRSMCEELGIPFLNMHEILAKQKDRPLYSPGDGHFNDAGHAVFAESLEKFVRMHTEAAH